MRRYLNLEQAVAACVQSPEASEANFSEGNSRSGDSPWSQEDSGEEYLPDMEGPCKLMEGNKEVDEEEEEEEEGEAS